MTLQILRGYFRRRQKDRMRGYRVLKHSGRLDLIQRIRRDLDDVALLSPDQKVPKLIFGAASAQADLCLRQYLMVRIGYLPLYREILRVHASPEYKMLYPLPKAWRAVFTQHNIPVSRIGCAFLWACYICLLWIYGSASFGRHIYLSFRRNRQRLSHSPDRAAYFHALTAGNLPASDNVKSYDILSWYMQWPGRPDQICSVAHSVTGTKTPDHVAFPVETVPATHPVTAPMRLRFMLWALTAMGVSLGTALRGRWWNCIMLFEAGKSAIIREMPDNALYADYLFHNSGWIYRPLWSFEAENRGSRILFYFYSTNVQELQTETQISLPTNSWKIAQWPSYLIWDHHQKSFLERMGCEGHFDTVGPIWFGGRDSSFPSAKAQIAVFDVQPTRPAIYQMLGARYEYYTMKTTRAFLKDIHDICEELGGRVLFKNKRSFSRANHSAYQPLIQNLERSGHFQAVDPGIAAQAIIRDAEMSISMPYTSTALIAREMGKPSCFYDPYGVLKNGDPAAHGIEVIQGIEMLRDWMQRHLKNKA